MTPTTKEGADPYDEYSAKFTVTLISIWLLALIIGVVSYFIGKITGLETDLIGAILDMLPINTSLMQVGRAVVMSLLAAILLYTLKNRKNNFNKGYFRRITLMVILVSIQMYVFVFKALQ